MHRFVMVFIVIFAPLASATAQTSPPRPDGESEALIRSLETACKGFSDERQWIEADACRRAWFSEHEEAVWRLNLNPHTPQPQPPS